MLHMFDYFLIAPISFFNVCFVLCFVYYFAQHSVATHVCFSLINLFKFLNTMRFSAHVCFP